MCSEPLSWQNSVIFYKVPFVISLHFSPFWHRQPFVFKICLIESMISYLYPKIINFDAVDFSQCHSKEVISFFWWSVQNKKFCNAFLNFSTSPVIWDRDCFSHERRLKIAMTNCNCDIFEILSVHTREKTLQSLQFSIPERREEAWLVSVFFWHADWYLIWDRIYIRTGL